MMDIFEIKRAPGNVTLWRKGRKADYKGTPEPSRIQLCPSTAISQEFQEVESLIWSESENLNLLVEAQTNGMSIWSNKKF